jgi:hypothetical protein
LPGCAHHFSTSPGCTAATINFKPGTFFGGMQKCVEWVNPEASVVSDKKDQQNCTHTSTTPPSNLFLST